MDDTVIRTAVGLCLGLPLCRPYPHECPDCGTRSVGLVPGQWVWHQVDGSGTHGWSCRFGRGCHPRHVLLTEPHGITHTLHKLLMDNGHHANKYIIQKLAEKALAVDFPLNFIYNFTDI